MGAGTMCWLTATLWSSTQRCQAHSLMRGAFAVCRRSRLSGGREG